MNILFKQLFIFSLLLTTLVACQSRTIKIESNLEASKEIEDSDEVIYFEALEENTELQNHASASTSGNVRATIHWKEKALIAQPPTRAKTEKLLLKESKTENILPLSEIENSGWSEMKIVRLTYFDFEVISGVDFLQHTACVCATMGCLPVLLYPAFVPMELMDRIKVRAQVYSVNKAELKKRLLYKRGSTAPLFDDRGLRPIYESETSLDIHSKLGLIYVYRTEKEADYMSKLNKELAPQLIQIIKNARANSKKVKRSPKEIEKKQEMGAI